MRITYLRWHYLLLQHFIDYGHTIFESEWKGLGQTNGLKVMKINATRGNIYADDGSLLATSLPL